MKDKKFISPFKCMCVTVGNLPIAYIESMSYYEALTYFMKFLENTIIPALNSNTEAIIELQKAYDVLKEYVDNYFDNLDVQEEINNKLDQMADDGVLADIIAQYLNLAVILTYDTLNDLKTATNVTDGSSARTLGYHSINDGGGALYKIREIINTDVVNEMDKVALDDPDLVAEMIIEAPINPKVFGAYGDGTHDDIIPIQYAINKNNVKLVKGNYYISEAINVGAGRIFDGGGARLVPHESEYAIEVIGEANTPKSQINIKDLVIDTETNGGNGIDMQYTYFCYIDNVNITKLSKNDSIGINQVNGFNDTITNSRVLGDRTYSNTYGIKITTTSGGTSNMTNNKYDTILLQNLTYGINANYTISSNVNTFNNLGFSNDDYCIYLAGYSDPIEFSNIRMEDTLGINSTGIYITGSIESSLRDINAYDIEKVIDNNGATDKKMIISGCISLTGTTHSPKYQFIYNSTQNIMYNADARIIGTVYDFDTSSSFVSPAVLVNGNGFIPAPSDITSGSTTLPNNVKYIYKLTTANLSNLFGRKNSECLLYTDEDSLKIVGTPSSITNAGGELTLTKYRIYHIKFIDNNSFIVSE